MTTVVSYVHDDPQMTVNYFGMKDYLALLALAPEALMNWLDQLLYQSVPKQAQCPKELERFRFHFQKDPFLLKQGRIGVTIYYRVTDEGPDVIQHPDNPWPDLYCREFYFLITEYSENAKISAATLDDVEELVNPFEKNKWRFENVSQFPESWEVAQERMRYTELYLPGTNVPREEATKEIYESLRSDLPRKQLF